MILENPRVRALLMGFPKSGKSGSLVALLKAGYRIVYCDFDGNPEVLRYAGAALENLCYCPFFDKIRMTGQGRVARLAGVSGEPMAYFNFVEMLETGTYTPPAGTGGGKQKLGSLLDWGPETVLVIDSMDRLVDAIWARFMWLKGTPSKSYKDWGAVVEELQYVIDMTVSPRLRCHTIWIGHLQIVGPGEMEEVPAGNSAAARAEIVEHNNAIKAQVAEIMEPRLFPVAVTKAQSQKICGRFPIILPYEIDTSGRRIINLQPRKEIDVALPVSLTKKQLPTDGGLLEIFQAITGQEEKK